MTDTPPLRIAALVRMSLDQQQNSPERQRAAFADYCARYGLVAAGEYTDLGVSATHTAAADRAGLQRLLLDAAKGLFDLVFTEEISRIARRAEEFFPLRSELNRRGVAVVTVHDDPRREHDAAHRFSQGVMALAAELEAGKLSERVRDTQRMMIAAGRYPGGCLPLGIGYDRATHTWEIEPHGAEIALHLFAAFVRTRNLEATAAELNDLGYRSPRGNPWTGCSVRAVLLNPVYRGRLRRNDEEFPIAGLPQIITPELLRRADAALAARRTRTKRCDASADAVFSGLLRCPGCGTFLTNSITTRAGTKNRYVFYYCYRSRREPKECPHKRFVSQRKLEAAVVPQLIAHLQEALRTAPVSYRRHEGGTPAALLKRAVRLDQERERLLQQHQKGWISDEQMDERMHDLVDRKAALAKEDQAEGTDSFTRAELEALLSQVQRRWFDWSVARRRDLLQTLLHHIVPNAENPAASELVWKD